VIHFPQIAGLGHSTMAEHAIRDLDQAKRYLDDPTLGERLRTFRLMLRHAGKSALQILGAPDDLKFRSCLTLFAQPASNDDDRCLIKQALDQFYEGGPDPLTENWQGRIDQARSLNSARRSAAVRPSRRKNKSSNCCFQKNG